MFGLKYGIKQALEKKSFFIVFKEEKRLVYVFRQVAPL